MAGCQCLMLRAFNENRLIDIYIVATATSEGLAILILGSIDYSNHLWDTAGSRRLQCRVCSYRVLPPRQALRQASRILRNSILIDCYRHLGPQLYTAARYICHMFSTINGCHVHCRTKYIKYHILDRHKMVTGTACQ